MSKKAEPQTPDNKILISKDVLLEIDNIRKALDGIQVIASDSESPANFVADAMNPIMERFAAICAEFKKGGAV